MRQLHRGPRSWPKAAASALASSTRRILLCLGLVMMPGEAQASVPSIERISKVCVLEGFLIGSPTGYTGLKYVEQVDWSKFEGKTVQYRWRFGRGMDLLLVAPWVVGVCDPGLVAAALPRALAQRAEIEFIFKNEHAKGLAEIERAMSLAPQNCEFIASRVFMLQKLGRRDEADAESRRAAGMKTCSPIFYQQKLQQLREGRVPRLN